MPSHSLSHLKVGMLYVIQEYHRSCLFWGMNEQEHMGRMYLRATLTKNDENTVDPFTQRQGNGWRNVLCTGIIWKPFIQHLSDASSGDTETVPNKFRIGYEMLIYNRENVK